jgi:hypothetical protein
LRIADKTRAASFLPDPSHLSFQWCYSMLFLLLCRVPIAQQDLQLHPCIYLLPEDKILNDLASQSVPETASQGTGNNYLHLPNCQENACQQSLSLLLVVNAGCQEQSTILHTTWLLELPKLYYDVPGEDKKKPK